MDDGYISEIRAWTNPRIPTNWAACTGQLMSISQNQALFALIGTTYGGDGISTFALPNLQGRVAINQGQAPGTSNYVLGQIAGVEEVTLTQATMPGHNHLVNATTNNGNQNSPSNNLFAAPTTSGAVSVTGKMYLDPTKAGFTTVALDSSTIVPAGGNLPHENRMPYLAINYIICLFGVFPSSN